MVESERAFVPSSWKPSIFIGRIKRSIGFLRSVIICLTYFKIYIIWKNDELTLKKKKKKNLSSYNNSKI